jgi:antitoxin (DNA-binding transcriptional repressor) of toxin-antitoxin stability system
MCQVNGVPSLDLDQLRDTRRLKRWLGAGKTVELRDRGRVIAHVVPTNRPPQPRSEWPDFAARRKKIFGKRLSPERTSSSRAVDTINSF